MHTDATDESRPHAAARRAGAARRRAAGRRVGRRPARATALVARGADVNAKDETQQSAYLIATSEGRLGLLRLTLAHGARVDDKDSWNGTGLIRAAERGHGSSSVTLLRAGIDRDHVNRIGYQAVHEAVWLGRDTTTYVDTVRVLVAGGAELTRPSRDEGLTPLQMARERGFDRLTGVLVTATTTDPVKTRTPRCSRPPRAATPTEWPWPCAPVRISRPGTRSSAPRCCSRPPATTSTPQGCSSRWAPTQTPWTTATTPRGSSPASPAASRCSRRSCRPTPT